ncbi:type VII secretion target [Actinoplanes sp. NBRC 101535]|uniref:type VII secretion target n=1 Tax=Actinoplanes sp. NBRC 101535 TaxID=3032196 RepID=UPI0024A15AAA|nr:type VII secretion target [Actinoplanes sp. NBRC 101535]GLY06766.1 hypothetical protein Acsp01_71450 [Actinoplanes sp. NBRC 101535]
MDDGSLNVPAGDVRRHTGHLNTIAGALEAARQAGDTVRPGPQTYGRLCVIVPALLGRLQAPLVEVMAAASRSVRETARDLDAAVEGYTGADEAAATGLRDSGTLR